MFESKSLYSKSIDNNITLFVHQNRFSLQLRRFAFRNSIQHTHTHTRAHTAAHIPYSTSKLILSLWQPYIAKHKQQSQNQTGGRQLSLSIVAHSYANTKWGTTLCLCEFIAAVRCMVKGSDSNPDLDEAPVREIMSITCVPNPESVPYRSNICRTCRL